MSDNKNLESALEQHLDTLGRKLEGSIEEWREASVEEREAIEGRIKSIENTMEDMKSNLEEERRGHLPGVEVATSEQKKDSFSMARACRALARKDFSSAPYEAEVFSEMKEKAMSVGVDPSGGYIVPEEAITTVIEALKANVVAYDLGARDMAASSTPLTIPKLTTSATGYWVSENSTINASDLGFEQINMTPKTVAGRVILSNLLLETSTPTADSIIEQDLASQLGLALDAGVLNGSSGGGAGEPVGIMQTAGISSVTCTDMDEDDPPTVGNLMEFINDLDAANALRGRLGWCVHPTIMNQIRQIKSENASPTAGNLEVSRFVVSDSLADRILGYEFRTSTQMAAPTSTTSAKSLLFGNWDDVMIARWGGLRLLASDTSDDAFSKDQTHIRATMRCDVALRHAESFSVSAD